MTKRIIRTFTLAAILTGAVGIAMPAAHAAPNVGELKVYQLPCDSSFCDSGDERVGDGGIATGDVQIQVQASSNVGLRWVQVDAQGPSGGWFCLRRWNTSAPGFNGYLRWDTESIPGSSSSPPSGCAADDGAPWGQGTTNATYSLRVRANDASGTTSTSSAPSQDVVLSNRPQAPIWYSDPRTIGNKTNNPKVELRWRAQPDEGIHEYHVVRINPNGGETEFAVSAAKPGGQGCDTSSSVYYTCYDDDFGRPYGGEYSYYVYGMRKTQASSGVGVGPCSIGGGNCIGSTASSSRDAALSDPAPRPSPSEAESPSPSPSPSQTQGGGGGGTRARPSSRPSVLSRQSGVDPSVFYEGTFDETLPFDQGGGLSPTGPIFGGNDGDPQLLGDGYIPIERDHTPYRAAAGGLLMVLVAAHMARYLRSRP